MIVDATDGQERVHSGADLSPGVHECGQTLSFDDLEMFCRERRFSSSMCGPGTRSHQALFVSRSISEPGSLDRVFP